MSSVVIETHKLNGFYGDAKVLFDIDFRLNEGEVVGVLGANGAGKSSFLKAISGLMKVEPGMITLRGEAIGGSEPGEIVRKGIAMVPEGRRLFPSMTVEENLKMGAFAGRKGRWDINSVYAQFPILKEKRNVPSTSLSGGQQQMVAIGRALMSNPDVLMCDEISLGLAPVVIKDIYDSLPNIVSEGMSVVIIEQDVMVAQRCSQRLYCLQEGRVSLEGASEALTRDQISQAYFGI
ncbi:ABC transporter ATP-binding protein [uncultured Amphritea sp.]|uniref:ABC transporter ATP-binding protein n=1 Tax=uncultured Amphritea sp. TaxID=981605 RepID=UPI00260560D8|nr:ABC transporter ATP-binding protein [uncultured Amphritea sp.]